MTKLSLLAVAAVAALSTVALAGGAQAQDNDANFSGFYVGGQVGGSFAPHHNDETFQFDRDLNGSYGDPADAFPQFSPGFSGGAAQGTTPAAGSRSDRGSVSGGARIGYDWQYGNWVVGGVGEYDFSNVRDSVSAYSTTPQSYTLTRKLKSIAAVRGRVGYTYDRYLGYLTAGIAHADVDYSFATTNTANTFADHGQHNPDGYQVGGGVETNYNGNIRVGLEYIYTRLDNEDYVVRASGGPVASPFTAVNAGGTDFRRSDDNFDIHSVRVTMAYRF